MAPTLGFKLPLTSGNRTWPHERSAGDWGERVEQTGFDSIWISEVWGSNVFVELAQVAERTNEIRFGTAISNVFTRTPATFAMAGSSLARQSDGRFVLGMGTSHPGFVEDLHGQEYHRPVRQIHETVELIKALTGDDESVKYDGQLVSAEGHPGLQEPFPVYNAALGEANRRATGRVADGWIPYLLPFSHLNDAFETIAETAEDAGRNPADIEVIPQVLACVDDDIERARRPIREYVASYIGNWEAYRNIFASKFPDQSQAIADAWAEGDEEEAIGHVSEEILAEFGVAGVPAQARDQLQAVLDIDVVDSAIVYVPNGTGVELIDQTIDALAPSELD